MSIINDALKKTQTELKNNVSDPKTIQAFPESNESNVPSNSKSSEKKNTWRIIFVLIFGGIILTLSFSLNTVLKLVEPMTAISQPPQPVQVKPPPPAYKPPASVQATLAAPKKLLTGKPILNGIMASGTENIALINNEIYKVGEMVDGKKIVAITLEEVILDDNGQQTTLNMRHY